MDVIYKEDILLSRPISIIMYSCCHGKFVCAVQTDISCQCWCYVKIEREREKERERDSVCKHAAAVAL